jgi:hypothetical protein
MSTKSDKEKQENTVELLKILCSTNPNLRPLLQKFQFMIVAEREKKISVDQVNVILASIQEHLFSFGKTVYPDEIDEERIIIN